MALAPATCATCGAPLEPGASTCAACHAPTRSPGGEAVLPDDAPPPPSNPGTGIGPTERPGENPFAADLNRRLARLAQWAESAEPLGVELPRLPAWAETVAARSRSPEPWAEVVRGVERLAQRRIIQAFDQWEERTSARIGRLEAYSVDSRLERTQVEDAVHAAKTGDLAQALATFQQVDRVVALKERHLDLARGELEHLLAFLRDLEALGFVEPGEPAQVGNELERELRTGRLAPLKQRLRLLRTRAIAQISESLADYVSRFGDRLVADRGLGPATDADARELAAAVKSIGLGHPEEGIRRLRALREATGVALSAGSPSKGSEA